MFETWLCSYKEAAFVSILSEFVNTTFILFILISTVDLGVGRDDN
jgi:hypothetical protein